MILCNHSPMKFYSFILPMMGGICAVDLHAQTYSLDWYNIADSGGLSVSADRQYEVLGTIGQPGAAIMVGGSWAILGSFWSSIVEAETNGAPQLHIHREPSSNTLSISWPSSSPGWILQQNSNLETSNWVEVTGPRSDDGVRKTFEVKPSHSKVVFYRLFKP